MRRPLFCRTCTALLDELAKAAEAAAAASPFALGKLRAEGVEAASEEWRDLRIRFLEIREKARQHIEYGHGHQAFEGLSCGVGRFDAPRS